MIEVKRNTLDNQGNLKNIATKKRKEAEENSNRRIKAFSENIYKRF